MLLILPLFLWGIGHLPTYISAFVRVMGAMSRPARSGVLISALTPLGGKFVNGRSGGGSAPGLSLERGRDRGGGTLEQNAVRKKNRRGNQRPRREVGRMKIHALRLFERVPFTM
jgi:hypothetical protein